MRVLLMCAMAAGSLAWPGCGDSSMAGDPDAADTSGAPDTTHTWDGSSDTPIDWPTDWVLEPGSGTLVPEGEATFHESDVGEVLGGFSMDFLPIAFSGTVYTMLVHESYGGGVAAYRMAPGGSVLETAWFGEVSDECQPSICWTGDVFAAMFPLREEGNLVLAVTEAGAHVGTSTIGSIGMGSCDWSFMDPRFIMCPASGPLIAQIFKSSDPAPDDILYLVNADATGTGTEIEVNLPKPEGNGYRSACFTVGAYGACFTGAPPGKMSVFFFDRSGNVWETGAFPDTATFYAGGAIADVGDAAAVVWMDRPYWDDHYVLSYSLIGWDGVFIVPPMSTGMALRRSDEMGLKAASSGNDILVVGTEPDERGFDAGTYLYLMDLMGNLLGDPLVIDPLMGTNFSTEVFWEGDAYAVIWIDDGGIYYRRYVVE